MNLRVDLILTDEQRSGSLVSVKSLGRVGSILIPLTILGLIFKLVWSAHQMNADFQTLQDDLEITKPRHSEAIELMETFAINRAVRDELAGRANSKLDWGEQIMGLMQIIPTNVQLRTMHAIELQTLINDRIPAREITLDLTGLAVNKDAESGVETFVEHLRSASPFANVVSNVVMDGRADNTVGAAPTDRIFEINAKYYKRLFK